MDYLFILDVITSYGLPTLIISAFVVVISIIVDLIFKDKIPTNLKINAPFFVALILCFIYDMVFVANYFIFREEALTFGLVSGSLSVVLIRTVGSIYNGETLPADTVLILIEGIIEEVVSPTALKSSSIKIKDVIDKATTLEEQRTEIIEILIVNTEKDISNEQIENVTTLILKAVSAL